MAELKMKNLRLLVFRPLYEQLMQELVLRRCVEFSAIGEEELEADKRELLSAVPGNRAELEKQLEDMEQALRLLEKYKGASKHVRPRKRELTERELLNDTGMNFALHKAEQLDALGKRLSEDEEKQNQLQTRLKQMEPWTHLDAPLGLGPVETVALLVGSVPLRQDVEKLQAELEALDERLELFPLKEDKKLRYIALLCMKEQRDEMLRHMKERGFVPAPEGRGTLSAARFITETGAELKDFEREIAHNKELIAHESIHYEALMLAADRLRVKLDIARAEETFLSTERTMLMAGRFPAGLERELAELFDALGCAYEISEPAEAKKGFLGIGAEKPRPFSPLGVRAVYHKLGG